MRIAINATIILLKLYKLMQTIIITSIFISEFEFYVDFYDARIHVKFVNDVKNNNNKHFNVIDRLT